MSATFLEDFHEDILGKAMRGLGIGKNEMAHRLGVEKSEIEAILNGQDFDENLINAMAGELKLDSRKLIRSAKKEWSPLLKLRFKANELKLWRYDRKCLFNLG